jgi:hypothetical protein
MNNGRVADAILQGRNWQARVIWFFREIDESWRIRYLTQKAPHEMHLSVAFFALSHPCRVTDKPHARVLKRHGGNNWSENFWKDISDISKEAESGPVVVTPVSSFSPHFFFAIECVDLAIRNPPARKEDEDDRVPSPAGPRCAVQRVAEDEALLFFIACYALGRQDSRVYGSVSKH